VIVCAEVFLRTAVGVSTLISAEYAGYLLAANVFRPRMHGEEPTGDDPKSSWVAGYYGKPKSSYQGQKQEYLNRFLKVSFSIRKGSLWFLKLWIGFYLPQFTFKDMWDLMTVGTGWLGYMAIVIPMGLFNVLGSMQNVESAEAAGDKYSTGSSMAVNGFGSVVAACFGSCFPTTIYIGHPGWKEMGARSGYSTLNGIVITLICLTGTVGVINSIVPLEAGIAIVLWIGVIITAQAFQATPGEHAPAVAVGLFPAIAAWGATVALGAYAAASAVAGNTNSIQALLASNHEAAFSGFLIHGMLLMERGYIFTCMILSAMTASLIEKNFGAAACWAFLGAGLTLIGLTHTYQLAGNGLDYLLLGQSVSEGAMGFRAYGILLGYLLMGGLFLGEWKWGEKKEGTKEKK